MNNQNRVAVSDINALFKAQGISHRVHLSASRPQNSLLVKGDLEFDMFPSGIGVHCSDLVEQEQASCSSQITPCISINFLLVGKLAFHLGN